MSHHNRIYAFFQIQLVLSLYIKFYINLIVALSYVTMNVSFTETKSKQVNYQQILRQQHYLSNKPAYFFKVDLVFLYKLMYRIMSLD